MGVFYPPKSILSIKGDYGQALNMVFEDHII